MGVTNCKHGSSDEKGSWQPGAREDHKVTVSTAAYSPAGGEGGDSFPQCNNAAMAGEDFPRKVVTVLLSSTGKRASQAKVL